MTWNQLDVSPSNGCSFFPTWERGSCVEAGPKFTHTHAHIHPQDTTSSDQALKCNKRIQVEEPLILNETSWLKKKKTRKSGCQEADVSPKVCGTLWEHLLSKRKMSNSPASPPHLLLCHHGFLSLHVAAPPPASPTHKGKSKKNSSPAHPTLETSFLFATLQTKTTLCSPRRMLKLKTWVSEAARSSRATDLWGVTTFDYIHLLKAGSGERKRGSGKGKVWSQFEHRIPRRCTGARAVH